jgi:hypothetical protein
MMDYQYNPKLVLECEYVSIPCSRRIFDRRLKTSSTDIKQRISAMGYLFITEGMVNHSIIAIDNPLLKAKGCI